MKFIGSLVLCLVIAINVKALTIEEQREIMKPLVMKCKAQENASDADIEQNMKHEIPTTTEGKCFHACVQTNLGVIVNGAYVPEAVVELARKLTNGDDAKVKLSAEIATACSGVSDGDRCELAFKILSCNEDEAAKRGARVEY